MEVTPPAADELEVSVFGPGYGECIVIHLGDNRWMVVDSCLDVDDYPIALNYFSAIGVPFENVVLVIASHWDDDHIRGLAEVVRACPNSTVFISSALQSDEFAGYTKQAAPLGTTRISSGVREIIKITDLLQDQPDRRRLASVDKLLISFPPSFE